MKFQIFIVTDKGPEASEKILTEKSQLKQSHVSAKKHRKMPNDIKDENLVHIVKRAVLRIG